MRTKTLHENGPFLFLFFVLSHGNKKVQIRLHQGYKTAKGSHTRRNRYYIWPIALLELKYIITSAKNAATIIAKDMVELRSIVFTQEKRGDAAGNVQCA